MISFKGPDAPPSRRQFQAINEEQPLPSVPAGQPAGYWACGDEAFATLDEVSRAHPPLRDSVIEVRRIRFSSTEEQRAMHTTRAGWLGRQATISGLLTAAGTAAVFALGCGGHAAQSLGIALMPVTACAFLGLGFQGLEALRQVRLTRSNPAPAYIVAEHGRIERNPVPPPPGSPPSAAFAYRAKNESSPWNALTPVALYSAPTPLDQT